MSYSFLDLAYDVLKQVPKPMTYQEVWQLAQEMGSPRNSTHRVRRHGKASVPGCT